MKRIIIAVLATLSVLSVNAQGMGGMMGMMGGMMGGGDWQARIEKQSRDSKAEMFQTQATQLAKQFKIKKANKDMFTVLYLDWQTRRFNIVNPNGGDQEAKEASMSFDDLTEEEADNIVAQNLNREIKQISVDKESYQQFESILTPQQIAEMFCEQKGTNDGLANQMSRMFRSMSGGGFGGGFGGGRDFGGGGGGRDFGGGGFGGGFGGF